MKSTSSKILALAFSIGIIAGALFSGCKSTSSSQPVSQLSADPNTTAPHAAKGSAQLWSETCSRCHNVRDPSTYSREQWEVAMQHMRLRANLTGEEHRRILEFLESAD